MELAYDLAQNYLVLVPLSSRLTERRIIKFSYTEQLNRPPTKRPAEVWKDLRQVAVRARTESIAADATGAGRLAITVAITARFTPDPIQQWYKQIYILIRHLSTGQRKRLHLDITGRSLEQLPVGEHTCSISAPAHFVALPAHRQRIYIARGEESEMRFELRDVGDRTGRPRLASVGLRNGLARWLGLDAQEVMVATPAIGHAYSYHLEVEAPEGLMVTVADLQEQPSYMAMNSAQEREPERPGRRDVVGISMQRVPLYISNVPQSASGLATIRLRPRQTTIVRAASMAAMFCSLLLAVVAWQIPHVVGNQGAVVALLIILPSALSAYVARPREPEVTSSMVFGTRLLALVPALLSVCGGVIVAFVHRRSINAKGQEIIEGSVGHARTVLALMAVLCAVTAALQWWVLRRIRRPPEQSAQPELWVAPNVSN